MVRSTIFLTALMAVAILVGFVCYATYLGIDDRTESDCSRLLIFLVAGAFVVEASSWVLSLFTGRQKFLPLQLALNAGSLGLLVSYLTYVCCYADWNINFLPTMFLAYDFSVGLREVLIISSALVLNDLYFAVKLVTMKRSENKKHVLLSTGVAILGVVMISSAAYQRITFDPSIAYVTDTLVLAISGLIIIGMALTFIVRNVMPKMTWTFRIPVVGPVLSRICRVGEDNTMPASAV